MRNLYAPPLLPQMIAWCGSLPGCQQLAPFLPSIVLGSGTIAVLWWMARMWFGMSAGLIIAFLAALSDYHLLFFTDGTDGRARPVLDLQQRGCGIDPGSSNPFS
ncbi:MAG: glycosyltransferase family 39 protein [Planctomycetaceae bacterium]